jgi:hypothetical protein
LSGFGFISFRVQIVDTATTRHLADSPASTSHKIFELYCPGKCARDGGADNFATKERL